MNKLEDQLKIKGIPIKNRLVLPPLTTNYGTQDGQATPDVMRFYEARSGHMGIVIVEAAAVSPQGRIVPGGIGLWNDEQITGMTELAKAIKAKGAMAVIQINHAGGKAWPFDLPKTGLSPSGIACRPGIAPFAATEQDIKTLIQEFVEACGRAKKAGFDGVEIHGAHLYLLSQFLSPLTNHRADRYGGSVEKRAALPVEVVKAVRESLGQDYPIFFRLNVMENLDGGLTVDDTLVTGKLLVKAGVDVLDLSLAVTGSWKVDGEAKALMTTSAFGKDEQAGAVTDLAAQFRSECGIPVITVGKLGALAAAENALKAGADMVAIGRQMICDPKTAEKILTGNEADILECEACMACFASLGKGIGLKCKHNKALPE
ncbi:MAG: NADH:flavin oxidoreductase [Desulfobacterales bacterium]|nr:NADH:flavin oxidoreductase [Desulfobacterales bacterium]